MCHIKLNASITMILNSGCILIIIDLQNILTINHLTVIKDVNIEMDFFHSQESLTAVQWILRAIVSFFFLLFVAKIMGQRSISQLRLLDFIMALSIGNIIAHPLSDQHIGMKGSMITLSVLVILYLIGIFSSLKWIRLRNFVDSPSFPLIENGKIINKNLAKARISIDVLLTELRKEKIEANRQRFKLAKK